jgi:NTE family protein
MRRRLTGNPPGNPASVWHESALHHSLEKWHLTAQALSFRFPGCGVAVKNLGRIVRSVKAFGRGLSGAPPSPVTLRPPRIGIALGGGFARGMAHIGILKVLEEENVPISVVAGTSVGALIGALYCSGLSAAELADVARKVRFRDFARWTISRFGFATSHRMTRFLNTVLRAKTFEELRIPLAVTATDYATGDGVVFCEGPLIDPVRASCAYPGMFLPVNIDGRLLVDGMLAHAVPTRPLRNMGADRVLAIQLKGRWLRPDGPRHVFDVIGQCFSIAQDLNCEVWKSAADLVVETDVGDYQFDDFEKAAGLIVAGETSMREAMPQIRKWLADPLTLPSRARTPLRAPAVLPAE